MSTLSHWSKTPLVLALLAATAHAQVGTESSGVNIHVGYPEFIEACDELGVEWVRVDANWFQMEPADDAFAWDDMDATVQRAASAGLRVFMTLAYTPAWVPRHGDADGRHENDPPNASAEWEDFVEAAVERYRTRGVTHFGLWNEANLDGFWEGSSAEYVDLVVTPGAAAVRRVCGDCLVLGPDLAHIGPNADDYLEGVLRRAGPDAFDIVTHHSYQTFAELGVTIFDGDTYIQVLDDPRWFSGRRSLRQVLDAVEWDGEVWITETGYRVEPVGSADSEDDAALHFELALQAQLERDWLTNTFIYEIGDCSVDLPNCPTSGFGLMVPTAGTPGQRAFPEDVRLTAAFHAIQDYIAEHPSLGPGGDEGGVTRPEIEAYRTPGLVLDGDLSDFGDAGWVLLDGASWQGSGAMPGPTDLAVRAAVRWEDGSLWLGVEVIDDTHDNTHDDADLWMGDSLQLALDPAMNGGAVYDSDDHELAIALNGEVRSARYQGSGETAMAAVVRAGDVTTYELLLRDAVVDLAYEAATSVGFTFLVNEADGAGREGWMEWTPGIGWSKRPDAFGAIVLVSETSGGATADVGPAEPGADLGAPGPDSGPDSGPDAVSDAEPDAGPGAADGGGASEVPIEADSASADGSADASAPLREDAGCACSTGMQGSSWMLSLLAIGALRRRREPGFRDRRLPR